MTVEWLCIRGTFVRLEGVQSEIDTVLRSVEVGDRVAEIAEYADQADIEFEIHP